MKKRELRAKLDVLNKRIKELEAALASEAKTIMASQTWLGTGGVRYATIFNGEIISTFEENYSPAGLCGSGIGVQKYYPGKATLKP